MLNTYCVAYDKAEVIYPSSDRVNSVDFKPFCAILMFR